MSATTTQKNTDFQEIPFQDVKKLTDVPGVGPKLADKLLEANIDTPIKLMGNFMLLGCDEAKMASWLETVCGIRGQDAKKVTGPLAEKAMKLFER